MHCSSLGSTGGNFIKNFSPSSSSPCASNHHAFARHLEGGQLSKRDLNYVRKFTRGFSSVQLDGVPVSVSEWLFGFFVLILFGVDEYFSCINYHISKDTYWARTGHLKAWVILALLYFLILLRSIENHSSGLKANLGGKLPTIVVAMFPSSPVITISKINQTKWHRHIVDKFNDLENRNLSWMIDWKTDSNPDINIVETLNGVMFVSKLEYWWKI